MRFVVPPSISKNHFSPIAGSSPALKAGNINGVVKTSSAHSNSMTDKNPNFSIWDNDDDLSTEGRAMIAYNTMYDDSKTQLGRKSPKIRSLDKRTVGEKPTKGKRRKPIPPPVVVSTQTNNSRDITFYEPPTILKQRAIPKVQPKTVLSKAETLIYKAPEKLRSVVALKLADGAASRRHEANRLLSVPIEVTHQRRLERTDLTPAQKEQFLKLGSLQEKFEKQRLQLKVELEKRKNKTFQEAADLIARSTNKSRVLSRGAQRSKKERDLEDTASFVFKPMSDEVIIARYEEAAREVIPPEEIPKPLLSTITSFFQRDHIPETIAFYSNIIERSIPVIIAFKNATNPFERVAALVGAMHSLYGTSISSSIASGVFQQVKEYATTYLEKLSSTSFDSICSYLLDTDFQGTSAYMQAISSTPLYQDAVKVCTTIAYLMMSPALCVFSPKTVEWFSNLKMAGLTCSLVTDVCSLFSQLAGGLKLFYTTRDWNDLFAGKNATRWSYTANLLLHEANVAILEGPKEAMEHYPRIEQSILEGKSLLTILPFGSGSYLTAQKLINSMQECLKAIKVGNISSQPRIAPIGIQILGRPSVGKTDVSHAIADAIQAAAGVSRGYETIYTINAGDKYDSSLKPNSTIYLFDDLGAIRPGVDPSPAHLKVIPMGNNAAAFATMAGVEDKGTMMYNPYGLVATTNTLNMGADLLFTCPAAYLRRWSIIIHVHIRNDCCAKSEDGKIKPDCISPDHPMDKFHDAQVFTLYRRVLDKNNDTKIEKVLISDGSDTKYDNKPAFTRGEMLLKINSIARDHFTRSSYVTSKIKEAYGSVVYPTSLVLLTSCLPFIPVLSHLWVWLSLWFLYLIERIRTGVYQETQRVIENCADQVEETITRRVRGLMTRAQYKIYAGVCTIVGSVVMVKAISFIIRKYVSSNYPTMLVKHGAKEYDIDYERAQTAPFMFPRRPEGSRFEAKPPVSSFSAVGKIVQVEHLRAHLAKATFEIEILVGTDSANVGSGTFVYDKFFMTCAHVLPKSFHDGTADSWFVVLKNSQARLNSFCLERNQIYANGDFSYWFIPNANRYKDIRNLFVYPKVDDTLCGPSFVFTPSEEVKLGPSKVVHGMKYSTASVMMNHETCLQSVPHRPIKKGESGSLVFMDAKTAVIFGMLVAASDAPAAVVQYIQPLSHEIEQRLNPTWITFPITENLGVELSPEANTYGVSSHIVPSACYFLGSIPGTGAKYRSDYRLGYAAPYLLQSGTMVKPGPHWSPFVNDKQLCIPTLGSRVAKDGEDDIYIDPQLVSLAMSCQPSVEPPMALVQACLDDYISAVLPLPSLKAAPLSIDQAINGNGPINPMNTATSAGFGMAGKKIDYMSTYTDDTGNIRKQLLPAVLMQYVAYEKSIFDGTAPRPMFQAHPKDEVISVKKMHEGRVRIFMAGPLFFLLACRRYLSPLIAYMGLHPHAFECMVGINALGPDWKTMADALLVNSYFSAGDFAKFDKRQKRNVSVAFTLFAWYVFKNKLGYNDDQASVAIWLIEQCVTYVVLIKGDVYEMFSSLPSGCLLTAILNSFHVSIYVRLVWYSEHTTPFRQYNVLRTFGDDHVRSTSVQSFDFVKMQKVLADFGLEYTAAAKDGSIVPFEEFEDLTFLKRKFNLCIINGIDCALAPLDEASIFRMLTYTNVPSEREADVLRHNLVDAHLQYFMYGEAIFKERRAFLQVLAHNLGIHIEVSPSKSTYRWRTYQELCDDYVSQNFITNFV